MDRSAKISIAGEDYELLLTTKAFDEIAAKYGGINELDKKLAAGKSFEEIAWLVALLANQSILRYNMKNPDSKMAIISAEYVELWSFPDEVNGFSEAIAEAFEKGSKRNVNSEDISKNARVE